MADDAVSASVRGMVRTTAVDVLDALLVARQMDHSPYRLVLRCRINVYAPLVTWNCSSFEREPGSDDTRIHWNAHEYPAWLEQRYGLGIGNVEARWLPEPPPGSRRPVRFVARRRRRNAMLTSS